MFAVEFNRDEILEFLLSHEEIYIDAADTDGYTPLIMAVEKSGEEGMLCADMLMRNKADPNLATSRRKTALKIACAAQDVPMVNLLMNYEVQRRPSALAMLSGDASEKIMKRIATEEKRIKEEADKAEKARIKKALEGIEDLTLNQRNRNPWYFY